MRRVLGGIAAALAALVALSGCASPAEASGTDHLRVVASTNVYGDIVRTIAGPAARVDALIADPERDPHDYAPSARDLLRVREADLVVVNGGGYDAFADKLVAASGGDPAVVDVTRLSGRDEDAPGFNEHQWYDVALMQRLGHRLAAALARLDPAHAGGYARRADRFAARLDPLRQREARLAARHAGTGVAVTEPLPLYLLAASGLTNRTPRALSAAVEEGQDVPPAALHRLLALIGDGRVALLAENAQAAGPQIRLVVAAARRAGVPVVSMRETLPSGDHYAGWMSRNLRKVAHALEGSAP